MYKRIVIVGAVLLLMLSSALNAAPVKSLDDLEYPKLNKLEIPEVDRVTLDNGMRLYLVEDKSLPVFNASVRVCVGSYLEEPEKVGLASILTTTLRTGGTQKWTGDEIDEILEAVGASVEVGSDITNCTAGVNALSEYTDLGLEVLADVLRRPVFDQEKIDLAKVQENSAISRRNDDPSTAVRREFYKIIYASAPEYARHTEYATIKAVSRDDLVAFHGKWFRPENIQMSIWGDFDREELLAKINKFFGDWERGNTPVPPLPEVNYNFERKTYYAEKTDVNQSNVRMGHIGGYITDDDAAATIVMNNILGGGLGGRMFNTVRTKEGLAYSTYGQYNQFIDYPGGFFNYSGTKSETTGKAARTMIDVIKSMQTEPPTADELRKGKEGYLNSFVFNFDSKGEVVNRLMTYDYHGLPDDFLQKQKENIEKVTAEDVVAAAKSKLKPDEMFIIVVGNAADFDEPLENLDWGPVVPVDITIPSGEESEELEITPETLEKGSGLLAAAITAHGGLDAFKNVEAVASKGVLTLKMQGQELPLQIESIWQLPNQNRTVASFMGQNMYDVRNNDVGWKTDQATMSIVPKTDEDLATDDKDNLRNNILIFQTADAPAYQAVYSGSSDINGAAVETVTLVDAQSEPICKLAFDAVTNELLGKSYWGESHLGEGSIQEVFSEFSVIEGIKVPMKTALSMNGQETGTRTYSEYQINPAITEGTFDQPQ
ncbi:MAG: insulinase family protein [bacterium]|nr:insulinase family protein [bacterium]